jgi:ketosteroid isomerase-like protein
MPASTGALEVHISQLLDVYSSKFNHGDFEEAASNYHEPAIALTAGSVAILPARKDLPRFFSGLVERRHRDGYKNSEFAGPKKIIVLDEKGLVLASCHCKMVREDGTSCEEFTATYTLRKTDDQKWLIAAIHQHPLETQLK